MLLQQTKGLVVRGGRVRGCRGILSSSSSSSAGKQGSGIRLVVSGRSNGISSSQRVLSSSRLVQQQQQLQVETAVHRMISTRVMKPSFSHAVATATMTTSTTTTFVGVEGGTNVGIGNKNYCSTTTIAPLNDESNSSNILPASSSSSRCLSPLDDIDDDGG